MRLCQCRASPIPDESRQEDPGSGSGAHSGVRLHPSSKCGGSGLRSFSPAGETDRWAVAIAQGAFMQAFAAGDGSSEAWRPLPASCVVYRLGIPLAGLRDSPDCLQGRPRRQSIATGGCVANTCSPIRASSGERHGLPDPLIVFTGSRFISHPSLHAPSHHCEPPAGHRHRCRGAGRRCRRGRRGGWRFWRSGQRRRRRGCLGRRRWR